VIKVIEDFRKEHAGGAGEDLLGNHEPIEVNRIARPFAILDHNRLRETGMHSIVVDARLVAEVNCSVHPSSAVVAPKIHRRSMHGIRIQKVPLSPIGCSVKKYAGPSGRRPGKRCAPQAKVFGFAHNIERLLSGVAWTPGRVTEPPGVAEFRHRERQI
jgi:hypothetical protein